VSVIQCVDIVSVCVNVMHKNEGTIVHGFTDNKATSNL
jgi:hypothetical protein